ncbi:MAG: alpha-amylase family glycosyl hydrolase [Gammaproteobacteria bacterium]|nr:alpha-amylase family glycosyl hydrolase [Gammaproteobacteria bacterium]MDH3415161.1 alpha-amylase family glycosyl hydrolase [Gammaproteobacteria bacterium]
MSTNRIAALICFVLSLQACGGGGSKSTPPPPPPASTITINYLRVEPAYSGWGLHLWGSAIDASVATTWNSPRSFNRVENGAAIFEIPITNRAGNLNLIAHNGDLKSPIYDLTLVPQDFAAGAWVVQDTVASLNGTIGTLFDNEADALAALNALGNASVNLDLSSVVSNDVDSGLPADWADYAGFIEIYVRGYQDSDGDGAGDIQGLISRLDYLAGLGVNGIWLMPVTESADNDHGYAVEDYRAIEQQYGTMTDFELLLTEAHNRGIAVIIDYVINHSASTNPLFLDASTSSANDKRDWYVWEVNQPSGWNTFAGDPWRNNGNGWYYGIFSPLMPDFNLRNSEVVEFHKDNLRFWLNKGVDGFRFDAVSVLFENGSGEWEDAPENHTLLGELQTLINSYNKRYLVCEAPASPADYAAATSCGRAFAFQVPGAILNSARNSTVDSNFVDQLELARTDYMPLILSNHDSFAGDRIWNQLNGNQEQYKLAAASYLLAARTPFTYYGEEIGLAGAAGLSGDAALRTPMSWTSDPNNAGFSAVMPFRELSANSTTQNVELESADGTSLLAYYSELMTLRNNYPVIGAGNLDVQTQGGDPVLLFARNSASACAVIAINYSSQDQPVSAMTSCPNADFDIVLGGSGTIAADASGVVAITVPLRTATVYHATP